MKYEAKAADRKSAKARKTSREHIHLTDEELAEVNSILSEGIRKGQPLAHIFAVHEQEIPITVLMENRSEKDVFEMDTVKGKRNQKKMLLTMILRRNSVMIVFLMPDNTADSVITGVSSRLWTNLNSL